MALVLKGPAKRPAANPPASGGARKPGALSSFQTLKNKYDLVLEQNAKLEDDLASGRRGRDDQVRQLQSQLQEERAQRDSIIAAEVKKRMNRLCASPW